MKGKLYHGNEVTFTNAKYDPRGAGTLILYAKNTITMKSKVCVQVGNGNAFICCKKLIMTDGIDGSSVIWATRSDNNRGSPAESFGTIAIYCESDNIDELIQQNNFHRGSYQEGVIN